ncbi:MAG: hypothetical protein AUH74_05820 [Nitrospirae bacterium 13_1_40CM_4_62_6]|nr:MAG: hypothetical protein AUH74_05820 [Nitrospirae bacterium 13_1_40CM_4_62_6]
MIDNLRPKSFREWRIGTKLILYTIPLIAAMTVLVAFVQHGRNKAALEDKLIHRATSLHSQIMADRQYYASVIVPRIGELGGTLGADYKQVRGRFPLPATFVHEVSAYTNKLSEGYAVNLISPWPINKAKGPKDQFQQEAFAYLASHPTGQFFRTDTMDGRAVMRVLMADRASSQSCVECHNAHPGSPKHDFKLGELMGGLEIVMPMDLYVEERREDLFVTVVGGAVLCALLVGIVVIGSNRTVTRPLGRLASKMRMFAESGRGTSMEGLPPDRGNEVTQLDQAFHRMVEVIVSDEKELRDLNASLEQRVLERTEALRSMEEQFRQAQKIEAIGRLAGGVAHDFNNLMTVVTGYSELILTRLGPDDPLCREIEEIKKAGDRATTLTGQLLAFSRKQVLAPKVLDLNAVVSNINGMLRRLLAEDIELHTVVAPVLGRVKADPGQLEQVIMNLVVNARDAMPGGGRLTIETKNVELDKVYAQSHVSVKPGAYVMLAITDGGSGMDATTQARIFEPFFTTKEPGKGTGLGLSTVYGVVKQSGGYIWVYSELGRGTTFKIYLPRVEDELEARALSHGPAETLQGSETILLAEDEDMVRALARRILTSHGYTVLEARDGTECLQICQAHTGTIHLLMTDVVMPGLSGRAVADRVAPLRPDMKVLYLSGYADNAVVHHGLLDSGRAFLQKPFSPRTLAHKVREVLDAPRKK